MTASLLGRRVEAMIFDWDGTAVADRGADASAVRGRLEALTAAGMHVAVVSGTHVRNVDGQLAARPSGPGRLWLALNRGSELFVVDRDGPRLVERRTADAREDRALDAAAADVVSTLQSRGVVARVVSSRLNRRKIDLIPEPDWADPPKAAIDRLVTAVAARLMSAGITGLPEVVAIAQRAAASAGLDDARITSDAKHVEIGLTDKRDSARALLAALWDVGVAPGDCFVVGDEMGPLGGVAGSDSLMLVPEADGALAVSVGVEPSGVPPGVRHLGGGPATFLDLLDEQLMLRAERAVPELHVPDEWLIEVDGASRAAERVSDALLTTSDGVVATTGATPRATPGAVPAVWHGGVYRGHGVDTALAPAPLWDRIDGDVPAGADVVRRLDLHSGVLEITIADAARREATTRFAALGHAGTLALRTTSSGDDDDHPLAAPSRARARHGERDGIAWMVTGANGDGVSAAARDRRGTHGRDRLACYVAGRNVDEAIDHLVAAERLGFDALLTEHRAAWAGRWRNANITIGGDRELDRAVRFSLFHLLQSAPTSGEAAVGARGLTGPAYHGHVFWDADVFVLPTLAATLPAAARAMLEYRVRRLAAAMIAARAEGRAGARFPWESATAGDDVTPRAGRTRAGEIVPILTGPAEVHIVADVALAAATYIDWTGDETFARGAGRELFVETARYLASRARFGDDGRAHIDGVIGPDEYHELVDDNAFTNVMARWNLRRAAAAAGDAVAADEARRWLRVADALVDGFDPATGRYEQFRGFYDLDDLVIADVAPRRPVTADLLLGRDRTMRSQVIKQADVLMLHHLIADETVPGSLVPNLDYYEPRCAHGSSLSPGVHASLLARAGRFDDALQWLRIASRVDLDDVTGTTSGGVHLATMGSVWQALAFGFAGLRPDGDALAIDPARPDAWPSYEVRVVFRGTPVRVRVGDVVVVEAAGPLQVRVRDSIVDCGDGTVELGPPTRRREERGW